VQSRAGTSTYMIDQSSMLTQGKYGTVSRGIVTSIWFNTCHNRTGGITGCSSDLNVGRVAATVLSNEGFTPRVN